MTLEAELEINKKINNQINATEDQIALEEFIDNCGRVSSVFRDISKRIASSCEKYLLNLSPVELAEEAELSDQLPICKSESIGHFLNNRARDKKKVKSRIIEFDENGIGYDINEPKKINEKNYSSYSGENEKIIKNDMQIVQYEKESQLTRDIREAFFFRNIVRKNEINYNYEKNIESILQSLAFEEFKAVISKRIYLFKTQNSKIIFYQYNKPHISFDETRRERSSESRSPR